MDFREASQGKAAASIGCVHTKSLLYSVSKLWYIVIATYYNLKGDVRIKKLMLRRFSHIYNDQCSFVSIVALHKSDVMQFSLIAILRMSEGSAA